MTVAQCELVLKLDLPCFGDSTVYKVKDKGHDSPVNDMETYRKHQCESATLYSELEATLEDPYTLGCLSTTLAPVFLQAYRQDAKKHAIKQKS